MEFPAESSVQILYTKADDLDDPLLQFTYALKARETKRQYPRRLKVFMDFIGLEGNIQDQAKSLKAEILRNKEWFKFSLVKFFEFKKEELKEMISHIQQSPITIKLSSYLWT